MCPRCEIGVGRARLCGWVRTWTVLAVLLGTGVGSGPDTAAAEAEVRRAPVPVIYCTDLFHPHEDPDDHFDLAVLYSLAGIDLRGVVLDQGERQQRQPGTVPVSQLNQFTGRTIRAVPGLGARLRAPDDRGTDQPVEFQAGVELILGELRQASGPVTVITVGSVRDLVAAYNREPTLLRSRVARVYSFIGEASDPEFIEYNVGLDPHAWVGLVRSGLPLYWVPCFDGGAWQNRGRASFWQASHAKLLGTAPDALLQYFIYALEKESADPIPFMAQPVDLTRKARLFAGTRNLWCAAVFGSVTGERLVAPAGQKARWLPANEAHARGSLADEVFAFEAVEVWADDRGVVREGTGVGSRIVHRFRVLNGARYGEAMTEATAGALARFPCLHP